MRLAVTGSRHWKNEKQIHDELDILHTQYDIECIIHGGAHGVDKFADNWALERGIPRASVRPSPRKLEDIRITRKKYLKRNNISVDMSHNVVAFHSHGVSDGTDYTITYARNARKLIKVVEEKE